MSEFEFSWFPVLVLPLSLVTLPSSGISASEDLSRDSVLSATLSLPFCFPVRLVELLPLSSDSTPKFPTDSKIDSVLDDEDTEGLCDL
jgi:hypothetical protein